MNIALEPGVPTLEHLVTKSLHRVDHVFCSLSLLPHFVRCEVLPHKRLPKTDHFPIISTLDLTTICTKEDPKRNFRDMDWEEFKKELKSKLSRLALYDPADVAEFDALSEGLTNAIMETIEAHVPLRHPTSHRKRWWSKELGQARTALHTLAKKAYKMKKRALNHPVIEEYQTAHNLYIQSVKDARTQHWEEWIKSMDQFSMWILDKFVMASPTDGGSAKIPTLKVKHPDGTTREVADNVGKSKALYDSFFYPPLDDPGIDPNYAYPPPKFPFRLVSDAQVCRAIKKLKPYKAPGPDSISNSIFTHCTDLLVPWLDILFWATFKLAYYPDGWKVYDTMVMHKPGKPDYTLAKAHRPVALCKTTPKILSSCFGEVLIFYAEKLGLLPNMHFGCRPGRTATDSLHYLVKWVWDSLRKGMVVSALFLDIQGAFPNMVIPHLVHNLRVREVPVEYTDWLQRRVQGHRTTLCFDDYRSEPFEVLNGLDQGCPASGPLYTFYNANLLDIPTSKDKLASAFVDDCIIAVRASTVEESNSCVVNMVTRPNGALDWSLTHASKFEIDKTGLIIFTNRRIPDPTCPHKTIPLPRPSVSINGQQVKPSLSLKFLGVILDQELQFKAHADYAAAKGKFWIMQTRRVSKTAKGIKGFLS